jgi:hypothetical protein
MLPPDDLRELARVAREFRNEARRNQSLRDAAFKAFTEQHLAWTRQAMTTLPDGATQSTGYVYDAPCKWTIFTEPDKTTIALFHLAALADVGNPDPVVPWPDAHNTKNIKPTMVDVFRFMWGARLPVPHAEWSREIDARVAYKTVVTLARATLLPQLAEAMWAHVRESELICSAPKPDSRRAIGLQYQIGWTKAVLREKVKTVHRIGDTTFKRIRTEAKVKGPPSGGEGHNHAFTIEELRRMVAVLYKWSNRKPGYEKAAAVWESLVTDAERTRVEMPSTPTAAARKSPKSRAATK